MPTGLELSVQKGPGRSIVVVRGEVDMDSSPRLLRAVEDEIQHGRGVQLELEEVLYCDSSGIATLVHALQLARKKGVSFELGSLSGSVQSVLELASLTDFFPRAAGGRA